MSYEVALTSRARDDLRSAADHIARRSPQAAERWFAAFVARLESLASFPHRCGLARENGRCKVELRQMLFGRRRAHCAVFTIEENRVVVLTIRHTAQADWEPDLESSQ